MRFDAVLGQDRAMRRLAGIAKTGRVPAALLFHGPEGVGKRRAARALAAALACEHPTGGQACTVCPSCHAVAKGVSADIRVVDAVYQAHLLEKEPEKALEKQREWKIDTIREITSEMQRRSFTGGYKIAVVDDAHRMNVEAQNALLKALEEPPERTLWILVTDKPSRLLPTVRSRIQPIAFAPLPPAVLESLLTSEGLPFDEAARYKSAGSLSAARREKESREAFGELEGPLAPFEAADALPKDLAAQRERVELALDYFAADARARFRQDPAGAAARLREVRKYGTWLRSNVSPSFLLQLAFLRLR